MKKIGLIGYGDFGKQIEFHLSELENINFRFFYFDDYSVKKDSFPFNSFVNSQFKDLEFMVCLGYKHLLKRAEIISCLKQNKNKIFTYVHPSAYVSKFAKIGEGVIIFPQCNIDINTVIGDGVVLNNSVVVSHDSVIGCSSFLSPGVCINGNVNIGPYTFIGSNSTISNGVTTGEQNIVGIGSVVTCSTTDNSKIIGNPARQVKSITLC
jgi:sugar O-acyltransferase (sialic acid O-acetyltransferase NeuD family)